ncbi:MAG: PIN domain-containing protein [bacterium]|nr:PIN domain-containing protein [bacterium]
MINNDYLHLALHIVKILTILSLMWFVGEVAYMVRSRIHQAMVIKFLATTAESKFSLIPILKEDIARAGQVMQKYHESDLDFVDCCLVALSERLNITHICTFDERDFRKIVPNHAPFFQLLPADLP